MDKRKLSSYQHKHARPVHLALGDNYEKIATMKMDSEWKDTHTAAEIVRRYNEHPELVEALETIHAWATSRDGSAGADDAAFSAITDIASKALKA